MNTTTQQPALNDKATRNAKAIVIDGWKLVDEKGAAVVMGQSCKTFRNERCTVGGGTPPHKSGSTGRISTSLGEFFPSVCDLQWVAA